MVSQTISWRQQGMAIDEGQAFPMARVSPKEMQPIWEDFTRNHFCNYRMLSPSRSDPVAFEARSRTVQQFTIGRIKGNGACYVSRGPEEISSDGHDRFSIYFAPYGRGEADQFGRKYLANNDITLSTTSEPAGFHMQSDFDTVTMQLPRSFVEKRVTNAEDFCSRKMELFPGVSELARDTLLSLEKNREAMSDDSFVASARLVGEIILLGMRERIDLQTSASFVRRANLARAKRIINRHMAEPGFGVTEIARQCGISVRYLHDLFRDDGRTVREFLMQTRLEHARSLLEQGGRDMSVTQIGLGCGFSNLSHFSTAFRAAFGMSPREMLYRRSDEPS